MYVVVNHEVTDVARFWSTAQSATANLPHGLKLVHTFPSMNGAKAVCVWEGESVDAVRTFLDPATAGMARNEYFQAPNKEGFALPSLSRSAGA